MLFASWRNDADAPHSSEANGDLQSIELWKKCWNKGQRSDKWFLCAEGTLLSAVASRSEENEALFYFRWSNPPSLLLSEMTRR